MLSRLLAVPALVKMETSPKPVDVHVGARIRLRRTLLGLSQENLADAVGLTFQQIQKYERGINRVGASRLYEFAKILNVPIGFFFDDMSDEVSNSPVHGVARATAQDNDLLGKSEVREFVRLYYLISDRAMRRRIFDLVKSMAARSEKPPI